MVAAAEDSSNSKSNGTQLIVSTLGPAGTYSHQAARKLFGEDVIIKLEQTIRAVFEAVDQGTSARGVSPIENSTNGQVKETHDCLNEFKVERIGKTQLDIGHALMRAKDAGSQPIRKIYSHEQGLGQCRRYLAERYPDAVTEATDSTALAAEMASREPTSLAVASLMCAEVYNLDVIDTEIQDGEANRTTFIAFRKAT
ncbi:Prephenate dehydratase [Cystobasidium minutum MCA 4210]|uniref:Prephenate dehydratase n=1 Tax=Cystobasidium minutum MCA 4210 TaxID=1397322 RepID=UPI0034CDB3AA|eukprot:jgi/Rhomi1/195034/gm1.3248_g